MKDRIAATCVFGSFARGDTDALSDKDVLIVSNDPGWRALETQSWKSRGWSVAAYTPHRLLTMSAAGSLFLQHLKTEGLVLSDETGFLRDTLSSYRPRDDYSHDESICLEALRLLEGSEGVAQLSHWAADVLFVIFRNAAILHLASRGIYIFSMAAIAEAFHNRSLISAEEVGTLASLRAAKVSYRAGDWTNAGLPVDGSLRIIEGLFGVAAPRGCTDGRILHLADPYYSLRQIEKLLIQKGYLRNNGESAKALRAWKLISDPRAYSWNIRIEHKALLEFALALPDRCDSQLQTGGVGRVLLDLIHLK